MKLTIRTIGGYEIVMDPVTDPNLPTSLADALSKPYGAINLHDYTSGARYIIPVSGVACVVVEP